MKGYPSTLNTREDYYNCLAMVQAGELGAAGLRAAVDALEAQRYIHAAVLAVGTTKKSVTIMYCPEIKVGASYYCGESSGTVKNAVAVHTADETDNMTLTLSGEIPSDATEISILSSVDSLALVGMTEDDITAIKGVLRRYE